MKHFLILLVVAIVTITIVLVIYRPDVIEKLWLWAIGLIGIIVALIKETLNTLAEWYRKTFKTEVKN